MLNTRFVFHNVGQGLFYCGKLAIGRNSFNFIYDCGSEKLKRIETAIKREFDEDAKVGLLFISHLHKDHVSGIPYLLKRARVNTVVLPYLPPLERLIVALQSQPSLRELRSFWADPVQFLINRGVETVILIGGKGPDESGEWLSPEGPLTPEPEDTEMILNPHFLGDDSDLLEKIKTFEGELMDFFNKGQLLVKGHYGYMALQTKKEVPLWTFRLYNYNVPFATLSNFEKCVKTKLCNISSKAIKEAIVDETKLRELKDCYRQLCKRGSLKSFNNTSLVLLHLPFFTHFNAYVKGCMWEVLLFCYSCWRPFEFWYDILLHDSLKYHGSSQFLTGDISLADPLKLNEITLHFRLGKEIKRTIVTLIPHHGSKSNWNASICEKLQSLFWIVSAGYDNKYGHPSFEVLEDICLNCKGCCSIWVNEENYFGFMGTLDWQ